ncbi:hypothetical protein AAHC03_013658 [Spirometra sp. Aus1]
MTATASELGSERVSPRTSARTSICIICGSVPVVHWLLPCVNLAHSVGPVSFHPVTSEAHLPKACTRRCRVPEPPPSPPLPNAAPGHVNGRTWAPSSALS